MLDISFFLLGLNVGLSAGGDPGVPAWVPTGAIGFADFTTGASGNYWDGTAAVTADQMFVSDTDQGGVFNSASLVIGSGLPGADTPYPGGKVIGLLGAAMVGGCQMVATFTRTEAGVGTDGSGVAFEAYHFDDWNTDMFFYASDNDTRIRDYAGVQGYVFGPAANDNGVSKLAAEINPGVALTASINGSSIISTTATIAVDSPINRLNFQVYGVGGGACFLKSLAVYPVGYAALNTLSAL